MKMLPVYLPENLPYERRVCFTSIGGNTRHPFCCTSVARIRIPYPIREDSRAGAVCSLQVG